MYGVTRTVWNLHTGNIGLERVEFQVVGFPYAKKILLKMGSFSLETSLP
jgi:hypothetical protein